MANREACELYVEQEIASALKDGKKPYTIGKELSDWVLKLFEVRLKPDTIKKRAQRHQKKIGTNVPKKSKPTETIENTIPEIIKDRKPQGGGKRKGAGRKRTKDSSYDSKKAHINVDDKRIPCSNSFKEAYSNVCIALENEKKVQWIFTSKEDAYFLVKELLNLIKPKALDFNVTIDE